MGAGFGAQRAEVLSAAARCMDTEHGTSSVRLEEGTTRRTRPARPTLAATAGRALSSVLATSPLRVRRVRAARRGVPRAGGAGGGRLRAAPGAGRRALGPAPRAGVRRGRGGAARGAGPEGPQARALPLVRPRPGLRGDGGPGGGAAAAAGPGARLPRRPGALRRLLARDDAAGRGRRCRRQLPDPERRRGRARAGLRPRRARHGRRPGRAAGRRRAAAGAARGRATVPRALARLPHAGQLERASLRPAEAHVVLRGGKRYGLMQLPPPHLLAQSVLDPATGKKLTFGDIRARGGSGVGCSALAQWSEGPGLDRPLAPRLLEGQCGNGSLSCWHRCMEISLAGVTEEDCSARGDGYSIQCVDQFDQIYVSGHGDFNPTCSNATETVTPRPPVVQPTSGEALTDQEWQSLTEPGSGANSDFSHKVQLDQQAGNTVLLWSLENDTSESGAAFLLHAKMIHRGTVGWMALGLENIGGNHNGMNGGSVVMAQYDPEQAEPLSVGEYRIHPTLTAFRHWKTPLESSEPENASLASSDFSIENGASVLEFRTSHVYKRALNLSKPIDDDSTSDVYGFPSQPHSVNRLIWALTQNAYCTADFGGYCAYHSSPDNNFLQREEFRGRVAIDLARGTIAEAVTTSAPEFTEASSAPAHARVQWAALLVASIMSPWLH
ncbi:unnamed protein product [Prorocentrum cordatum]|uniref:DOMON domain-containing protein n=1 Tax=Prorocentrum cordatum TaxID=2364126 RepID=A0ABN9XKF2_9DINO|nr:unnamed protein product [Polarella glacialis]